MERVYQRRIKWEPLPYGSIVASSPGRVIKGHTKEAAGRTFHELALLSIGISLGTGCISIPSELPTQDNRKQREHSEPRNSFPGTCSMIAGEEEKQDLYALLGLSEERWSASEKQIEKAFRSMALKFHPDKCATQASDAEKEQIEARFKDIQDAYAVLSDARKRREYDSITAEEYVLPRKCAPGEFFKVYGDAVLSLSRWSTVKPVPKLGDDKTPIKDVEAFYSWWYHKFKSWREFPHEEEHDLEEAEGREHRRWMQRENEKMRRDAKRSETADIRSFVESMECFDPRIRAQREKARDLRNQKKQAKEIARRMAEEEHMRAAAEAHKAKEEAEAKAKADAAEAKKQREKEKKAVRKERARLRSIAACISLEYKELNVTFVEKLCELLGLKELESLCDQLDMCENIGTRFEFLQKKVMGVEPLDDKIANFDNSTVSPTGDAVTSKKCVAEEKESIWPRKQDDMLRSDDWSNTSELALIKAMKCFPKGCTESEKERW
eukprot:CAMPEP_0183789064 /NCGR_PEP_ID=MMETSP0803_2-20130417/184_1 /TAXON_ID=195967 /ORGANISM="Crustomastix stigmata, Strain CCMP3273" /LENGTH=494 /DNA_ID=CAMNT_0026033225 /DNA_START=47 /DNA_END=1528 /DNA_ORIENTATION=+